MDKKDKIVQVSMELFKHQGIKNVSMDDICKELGMSKKTVYANFNSKKELVEEVINHLFKGHFSFIESKLKKNLQPIEKIWKIYEYGIDQMIQVSPIFYWDLKEYYSSANKIYKDHKREIIFNIIKKLLEEAQIEGIIYKSINVNLFCKLNLSSLDKVISENYLSDTVTSKKLFEHTIGVSLNGILSEHYLSENFHS